MDVRRTGEGVFEEFSALYATHHLGAFTLSAEEFRAPGGSERYVASSGGRVVAAATVQGPGQGPGQGEGGRRVEVFAEVGERGDDGWNVLHGELVAGLRAEGVREIHSVVREDYPAGRRLVGAGYRVGWLSWGARLQLDGLLAEDAYAGVRGEGVGVVEIGVESAEAAFALYEACVPDFPRTPVTLPVEFTVEGFARLLADSGTRAFAVFEGAACVALSVCEVSRSKAETLFTVVAGRVRRRGLAKVVKARCIAVLASEGVRRFGTGGAAANEASLRMNQALGYVIDPLWQTWVLEL
jgi:hypothetical protein